MNDSQAQPTDLMAGQQCRLKLRDGTEIVGTFRELRTIQTGKNSVTEFCLDTPMYGHYSTPLRHVASWESLGVKK